MKRVITLGSIDKITKGQVLINRKYFKNDINSLRQLINDFNKKLENNPFSNDYIYCNIVLDKVDTIMKEYNVTQTTITAILQISKVFFGGLRKKCDRVLFTGSTPTLLKDRITFVNMLKMELITVKQVALLADVNVSTVYLWLRNDKEFGLHLEKAIAFRHAKI